MSPDAYPYTLMFTKSFLVVAMAAISLTSAWSTEIKDTRFGFRVTIPDDFKKVEPPPSDKEVIYLFMKGEPTPERPSSVIQIQRLGGVIRADHTIKGSKLPEQAGLVSRVDDFEWQGRRMDLMQMTLDLPTGGKLRSYTFQCPLSGEAVQLVVGGPVEQEAELRSVFDAVTKSLVNTKPLHGEGADPAVTTRELTSDERQKKMWLGIFKMSVLALVVAILVRGLFRALRGKKSAS